MRAEVSVILPSLNVANYIRECMDSLLCQTLQELEILCIDAGSTDGTEEILRQYAKSDSRIVLLHSDIKSYGRQVNIGLAYASGEYVAILETDDWIAPDMYRCLYEAAAADRLDYAAADFDTFYRLQNGNYYFRRQRLFGTEKQDWYNKILDSDQIATLRSSDYVLWKGIYSRAFLLAHRIKLHESPGAAFQDMGFLQQVKTYARKAKYLDQSFYRYRQNREEASSQGVDGLKYYEREFSWIQEELKLGHILEGIHRKYYYFTMSISFLTKYEQILIRLDGDWKNERLTGSYKWFKGQIMKAVKSGLLEEDMYGSEMWTRLLLLLSSPEAHAWLLVSREKKEKYRVQELREMTKRRPVIIFGCGIRGERLMLFCDKYRIEICAFCDNNPALQGKQKYGFPVLPPSVLKDEISSKDAVVLLSMKNGTRQVRAQLVEEGIKPGRIIDQLPAGIL